jgi:phosphoribosylaminoimidazole-succinocarboxamide synthase
VYVVDNRLVSIASDRISSFDYVLPEPIPFKGQVLNQLAVYFLEATRDIVPNWFEASPDPNVSVGKYCEPIKLEMVIRGYLAGHAWRTYRDGGRVLCGEMMEEGLREGDRFSRPIITPATKAEEGHDEDISRDEILKRGIVDQETYDQLATCTRKLFERGQNMAIQRGLILVDTKYEFGLFDGVVHLIDEVHTPDSSRYYILEGYSERQSKGEKQVQLSKEFVREWLMSEGFQGLKGQKMPEMNKEIVHEISERYIRLYELVTGKTFERRDYDNVLNVIFLNTKNYLTQ